MILSERKKANNSNYLLFNVVRNLPITITKNPIIWDILKYKINYHKSSKLANNFVISEGERPRSYNYIFDLYNNALRIRYDILTTDKLMIACEYVNEKKYATYLGVLCENQWNCINLLYIQYKVACKWLIPTSKCSFLSLCLCHELDQLNRKISCNSRQQWLGSRFDYIILSSLHVYLRDPQIVVLGLGAHYVR